MKKGQPGEDDERNQKNDCLERPAPYPLGWHDGGRARRE